MNQKDMNDEMEIDLLDLAYMLMDHWHHLLLCLLAGAVIFNAYAFFGIQPPLREFYIHDHPVPAKYLLYVPPDVL